jgi:nuclear pore complex protein Nup107
MTELEGAPGVSLADLDQLRLEADTWALLQVLMAYVAPNPPTLPIFTTSLLSFSERKTAAPPAPTPQALLAQNPYTPTADLARAALASSRTLRELVLVRAWAQDTAPAPPRPEGATGFRRFTALRLAQAARMGGGAAGREDGLVRRLDPDAVGREEGRALAPEDAVCDCFLVGG